MSLKHPRNLSVLISICLRYPPHPHQLRTRTSYVREWSLRKLKKLSNIGTAALDAEDSEEFEDVVYDMAKIYSSAVVPSFMDRNKLIKLEPKVSMDMLKADQLNWRSTISCFVMS